MTSVFDGYLVDPKVSLLDKTRMQAQVLVPVLRALRTELGKEKADAIVKQALRDWSKELFAAIGDSVEGSPRRKWATMQSALGDATLKEIGEAEDAATGALLLQRAVQTIHTTDLPEESERDLHRVEVLLARDAVFEFADLFRKTV